MTLDPTALPHTIDALHLGLAFLVLVFLVLYLKKGHGAAATPTQPPPAPTAQPATAPAKAKPQLKQAEPDAALQLLALLQQEARFVDFIQEDLSGFSDADIGAAARVVHEGGRKVFADYFVFEPIRTEPEDSAVSLPEGFNAAEVRLTGKVMGEPPFNGTLIHRGWRVTTVKLPKLAAGHDARVIAPAEVEL